MDIYPDLGARGPTPHDSKSAKRVPLGPPGVGGLTSQVLERVQGSLGLRHVMSPIALPTLLTPGRSRNPTPPCFTAPGDETRRVR